MPEAYPDIPKPSSFNGTHEAAFYRQDTDAGLPRQVLKSSTLLNTYTASWNLTGAQYALFKTWVGTTLQNGALWFTLEVPTEDGFVAKTLRFVEGKYNDRYRDSDNWDISATLEEEITQVVADPDYTPIPSWYRPTVTLVGDITAVAADTGKKYRGNPGTGNTYQIEVPDIADSGDVIDIGVSLQGKGAIVIKTPGEEVGGGGGVVELTWEQQAQAVNASYYRFDDESVVTDGSNYITDVPDLNTDNANDLTDPRAPTQTYLCELVDGWASTPEGASNTTPTRGLHLELTTNMDSAIVLVAMRFPSGTAGQPPGTRKLFHIAPSGSTENGYVDYTTTNGFALATGGTLGIDGEVFAADEVFIAEMGQTVDDYSTLNTPLAGGVNGSMRATSSHLGNTTLAVSGFFQGSTDYKFMAEQEVAALVFIDPAELPDGYEGRRVIEAIKWQMYREFEEGYVPSGEGGGLPDWNTLAEEMTGVRAIYDMADATADGSNFITDLVDSSGNGNDASRFAGGTSPTKVGNYAVFEGAHRFSSLLFAEAFDDCTMFIVYQPMPWDDAVAAGMPTTGTTLYVMGARNTTSDKPYVGINYSNEQAGSFTADTGGGTSEWIASSATASAPVFINGDAGAQYLNVCEIKMETGQTRLWHNGLLTADQSSTPPHYPGIVLGASAVNHSASNQYMKIRAVILFDDTLSDVDRETMREALMLNFRTVDAYT